MMKIIMCILLMAHGRGKSRVNDAMKEILGKSDAMITTSTPTTQSLTAAEDLIVIVESLIRKECFLREKETLLAS